VKKYYKQQSMSFEAENSEFLQWRFIDT
jgi:hypothetical protein